MDTLSLISQTPQFKSVAKDRFFYDRFEYVMGFTLDEASCLRDLSHTEIDRTIKRRREWRDISLQRWNNPGPTSTILTRRKKEITETTVERLHSLADILLNCGSDFKLVVSVNQCHVYTNNLVLIDQLTQTDYLLRKTYSQARIVRPKNTIQLKNPKHQFRSYFRFAKITHKEKADLANFFQNQAEQIRLSPALVHWIPASFTRTQDYFFVDHDTMSWLTMLSLVRPGLIRKTMQIISAK